VFQDLRALHNAKRSDVYLFTTALSNTDQYKTPSLSLIFGIAFGEELNLASINHGPLGMGLLAAKFVPTSIFANDDVRHHADWHPSFKNGKPTQEWLDKLVSIREVLTSGGRTLSQGALAWIWARSPKTVPIPGFKTVAQIEGNCKAMEFGPLDSDQMTEIDNILGRG
jgi:aryl-alcohol dehydrogenase-like predicted oxidoreductase